MEHLAPFAGQVASRDLPSATHRKPAPIAAALTAAALLLGASAPAVALDGCLVLLCLAAPSWRAIPQCVPPIKQLWRDLARGKAFPSCSMAGGANSASHAWAAAPSFCPPQYTRRVDHESSTDYLCDYAGAVAVTVHGQLFGRTWWRFDGDSVTEFSPAAKAMLGTWDTRFDTEYAAWLADQPPTPPVESGN
jgi:hypothetical protein